MDTNYLLPDERDWIQRLATIKAPPRMRSVREWTDLLSSRLCECRKQAEQGQREFAAVAEATAKLGRYLEMNYPSCRVDDVQQWAIDALQQEDIKAGLYSARVGKLESALATQIAEATRELTEVECRALDFAAQYHAGQLDKGGKCYLAHAVRVALAVRRDEPNYFVTGVLHDVVEDTPCTLSMIRSCFGQEVMEAVASVTRRKDGESKENYREYVSRAASHPIGLVVKQADVRDNLRPERIGSLDERTQARLREKYKVASEIIDAALAR